MSVTLEILGSGGATTIPKPLCCCDVCQEARVKGYPYKRTAPSVFLHGPDVLFDTPEETKEQIERAGIKNINAGIYSHWHPDHTAGVRLWEINKNGRRVPKVARMTPVYLPENTLTSMQENGIKSKLDFFEKRGWVKNCVMPMDQETVIEGIGITPVSMAEEYTAGFSIRIGDKKVLLIMDETYQWQPREDQKYYDVVVMPTGMMEFHPLTGERRISEEYMAGKEEPTFDYTLKLMDYLKAKRFVLSHIEEPDRFSYDDFGALATDLQRRGYPAEFAYDGMKIVL